MQLAESGLPADYTVTGDADAWPLISLALLSRMTMTLRHILDLLPRGRGVDAGTLLRSLYEHLVHFAWLAAEPTAARIEEWRKDDLRQRLKADNDARQRGVQLYSDEAHANLKRQVASMNGERLVLEQLAQAADTAWAARLQAAGLGPASQTKSFRGLYAILYRNYSAGAHPSYRGLNPVVEGDATDSRKRVVLEGPYEGAGPYGMATVIYTLALYVAAESLGWPKTYELEATFKRYPVGARGQARRPSVDRRLARKHSPRKPGLLTGSIGALKLRRRRSRRFSVPPSSGLRSPQWLTRERSRR